MAAQYDLKKSVSPKGKEDTTILYPKVVPYGTKTLKDITKDASMYTGMNASTVQGVLTFLEEILADYLANGYNVKLGNIGTFEDQSCRRTSEMVFGRKNRQRGTSTAHCLPQKGTSYRKFIANN